MKKVWEDKILETLVAKGVSADDARELLVGVSSTTCVWTRRTTPGTMGEPRDVMMR